MSDYLTSLAARALGVADVARPRRSLFEPRRGAPEPVEASEPAPPSSLGDAPAERDEGTGAPTAASPVLVPEPPPQPPLRAGEPSPPEAPAKSSRREPQRASSRRPPATALPVATGAVTPESAPSPRSQAEERAPNAGVAPPPVPRRGTDPQIAPQPVLTARPPRVVDRPDTVSPPTVRVTIGRVDVRAVVPEQPEPKRKPRPAPRMSLDEYLSGPRSIGR
jgi:hypothetical protein